MGKIFDFLKEKGVSLGKAADQVLTGGRVTDAVQAVGDLVGVDVGSEDELIGRMKENPELVKALKQQEARLQIRMHEIAAKDRASARKRQRKTGDQTPAVLAYTYFAGALLVTGAIVWMGFEGVALNEGVKAILYNAMGSLWTLTVASGQFFHGSSEEAARQGNELRKLARGGRS